MILGISYQVWPWLAILLAIVIVIGRTLWVYRGSSNWPTADGTITRLDVERRQDGNVDGGHYFRATFTYEFQDTQGQRISGTWGKNFSTEEDARDFAERELPVGKALVVRFNPKDPSLSDLELDSFVYTNDRPTTLNI